MFLFFSFCDTEGKSGKALEWNIRTPLRADAPVTVIQIGVWFDAVPFETMAGAKERVPEPHC